MLKPAIGPLLTAVRHRFARLYADGHDGLRNKRVALPATDLMRMVRLGLSTTDPALRRRVAGLTLTALTFARPGREANLRRMNVILTPTAINIQVPHYKHGARTNRERLVIRIPRRAATLPDAPFCLVHDCIATLRLATSEPDQPLFTPVGDLHPLLTEVATAWMRECIHLLNITTPAGCIFSGHSLRAAAATAARSIGGLLDLIATLMQIKNKDTTKVTAVYVDALAHPNDDARELYNRYIFLRR